MGNVSIVVKSHGECSMVTLTGVLWRVVAGVVGARSVRVVSFLCPGVRPQGEVCLGQQQSLLQAVRWLLEKTSVPH